MTRSASSRPSRALCADASAAGRRCCCPDVLRARARRPGGRRAGGRGRGAAGRAGDRRRAAHDDDAAARPPPTRRDARSSTRRAARASLRRAHARRRPRVALRARDGGDDPRPDRRAAPSAPATWRSPPPPARHAHAAAGGRLARSSARSRSGSARLPDLALRSDRPIASGCQPQARVRTAPILGSALGHRRRSCGSCPATRRRR